MKYLAESFDNMKFQHTRNAAIFRPLNNYILHYNGECGLYYDLKGNGIKNLFGVLYMYTVGPLCQIQN